MKGFQMRRGRRRRTRCTERTAPVSFSSHTKVLIVRQDTVIHWCWLFVQVLVALLALGCAASEDPLPDDQLGQGASKALSQAGPEGSAVGTFRFQVCRFRCAWGDTTLAYAIGELALFPGSSAADEPTSRYALHGQVNGCSRVRKRQDVPHTYLGIDENVQFHWVRNPSGEIRFDLFRSPDAGYPVAISISGDSLLGRGTSEVCGVGEISAAHDYIVGRRTGTPDRLVCTAAGSRRR
jgi:hypothetical protein